MAKDETHSLIDRGYDFVENFVDNVGRAIGIDTSPVKKSIASNAAAALPAQRSALALPASTFSILESLDEKGKKTWTVTNGIESADCSSRAMAEQVLAVLSAKLGGVK